MYNNEYSYKSQRPLNNPPIIYSNPPINYGNFNPFMNTNDPSILCISGNAYTIKTKGDQFFLEGPKPQVKSIRINMSGSMVKAFNLGCWISTIIFGAMLGFPLFFICCDWWKKIAFQTFNIEKFAYEGLAQIIQYSAVEQIYISVQDNFFDLQKAHILIDAVSRSRVKNFTFSNITQGFDIKENNYSDFDKYMIPFSQYAKFTNISWGRKFVK